MSFSQKAWSADDVTCECKESSCGPCETETGVTFYSAKCGAALERVKSCKKPTCVAVPEQNKCLARLNGVDSREPAFAAEDSRAGEVVLAVGDAKVLRQTGKSEAKLTTGEKLFAGDRVLTGLDGRVRVRFPELSEIFVSPQSSIRIEEALIQKPKAGGLARRKILLDLTSGRVRSRVQGRYDDGQSSFQVKTRSAVAGVRGTDFVTSYQPGASEWTTEVRTISGEVALTGASGRQAIVQAKTYAAYIVQAPKAGASEADIKASLAAGFVTPVFKISDEDIKSLEESTDIVFDSVSGNESRGLASTNAGDSSLSGDGHSVCQAPAGAFNQCSWSCEGNPAGEKNCRVELPGVACVRKLCRANGQWAEPTRLTPKEGTRCDATKPIVGACGSYW